MTTPRSDVEITRLIGRAEDAIQEIGRHEREVDAAIDLLIQHRATLPPSGPEDLAVLREIRRLEEYSMDLNSTKIDLERGIEPAAEARYHEARSQLALAKEKYGPINKSYLEAKQASEAKGLLSRLGRSVSDRYEKLNNCESALRDIKAEIEVASFRCNSYRANLEAGISAVIGFRVKSDFLLGDDNQILAQAIEVKEARLLQSARGSTVEFALSSLVPPPPMPSAEERAAKRDKLGLHQPSGTSSEVKETPPPPPPPVEPREPKNATTAIERAKMAIATHREPLPTLSSGVEKAASVVQATARATPVVAKVDEVKEAKAKVGIVDPHPTRRFT